MRFVTLILAALIGVAQVNLWFGKGSVRHQGALQSELNQQLAKNQVARERNTRLLAEVSDLREGQEMVEERARQELGMVAADEVLVQYAPAVAAR